MMYGILSEIVVIPNSVLVIRDLILDSPRTKSKNKTIVKESKYKTTTNDILLYF